MVFRYLRQLEGVSPPLMLTHLACQTTAKAWVATRTLPLFVVACSHVSSIRSNVCDWTSVSNQVGWHGHADKLAELQPTTRRLAAHGSARLQPVSDATFCSAPFTPKRRKRGEACPGTLPARSPRLVYPNVVYYTYCINSIYAQCFFPKSHEYITRICLVLYKWARQKLCQDDGKKRASVARIK